MISEDVQHPALTSTFLNTDLYTSEIHETERDRESERHREISHCYKQIHSRNKGEKDFVAEGTNTEENSKEM